MINSIPSSLTGERLLKAIENAKVDRKPLAEEFLYEKTILMISAEPGIGKSTISTQIAVELAAGLPLFGYFEVPKPIKVFYILTERSVIEILERLETIGKTLPIKADNLIITDEYQKLNLLNHIHVDILLKCIRRDYGGAKIFFIDPIYSTISGGLKDDRPASIFTKVMNNIQKEFNCALYYNHHTVKTQYTQEGERIERADPFYGSQWLKAHVTGSYAMKETEEGVTLNCKKDNYRLLATKIPLEYNPETELCSISQKKLSSMDKINNFIKSRKIDKKEFSFKDIQTQTGLCIRTVRGLLMHRSISDQLIIVSNYKNRNLYKVKEEKESSAVQTPSI